MDDVVYLSKLEAAERQLKTALQMYAEKKEPVATYTLAAAARTVIRDLARHENFGSILEDTPQNGFCIEQRQFRKILNSTQNFLKHADKDPKDIHDFRADTVCFILFDAVEMLTRIQKDLFIEALAFRHWFFAVYPSLLLDEVTRQRYERVHQELGEEVNDFGLQFEAIKILIERNSLTSLEAE
jgi:hypothetical protein